MTTEYFTKVCIKSLWEAVDVFRFQNRGVEPKYITINIEEYYELVREAKESWCYNPTVIHNNSITFQGIRILRTEDLEKGIILIS